MPALDVQPVLDVQPAAAGGAATALDVQPAGAGGSAQTLDLQPVAATPATDFSKLQVDAFHNVPVHQASAYGDGVAPDSDFLRAIAQNPKGFLKSIPGDVLSVAGGLSALPYKAAADVVAQVTGDSYGGNLKNQEENPDAPAPVDTFLAGTAKTNPALTTVAKIAKGVAESAPMAGVGALPAAVAKTVVAGFTADMLYHAPGTAHDLYEELQKPADQRDDDKITSLVSDGVQQLVFGGLGAAHLAGELAGPLVDKYVPRGQGIRGQATAPDQQRGATILGPDGKPAAATQPPGPQNATDGFSEFGGETDKPQTTFTGDANGNVTPGAPAVQTSEVPANPEGSTVPESQDTMLAQMKWLQEGKRAAVLFTHPDQTIPEFLTKGADAQFAVQATPAGRFLYDTSQLTGDQIDEAVKANKVGQLLGYGIDAKPDAAATIGAVVVRDAQGREKQAVTTDAGNLPNVMQAAQKLADPGDTIRVEKPQDVIAARQAAATPPATAMSEKIRMARENVLAMADLHARKMADAQGVPPTPPAPPLDMRPTERVESTGADIGHQGERPDDLLDYLKDHFPSGVKISSRADYGEYLKNAKGPAKELMSATRGRPADQVLGHFQHEGMYRGLTTEDELLGAMNRAAEARAEFKAQKPAASEDPFSVPKGWDQTEGGDGLTSGEAQRRIQEAINEKHKSIKADAGQGGHERDTDVVRRQQTESAFKAVAGRTKSALAGASPDHAYANSHHGRQLQTLAAAHGADVAFYRGPDTGPAGFLDGKTLWLRSNSPKPAITATFEHELSHHRDLTGDAQVARLKQAADLTSPTARKIREVYDAWLTDKGLPPMSDERMRQELTAYLLEGVTAFGRDVSQAFRNPEAAVKLAEDYHKNKPPAAGAGGGHDVMFSAAQKEEPELPPGRQRVEKIVASPEISQEVKDVLKGDLDYQVRSFQKIQDEASSILSARGLPGAIDLFMKGDSQMREDTRAALGARIQEHLRTLEQTARAAGDTHKASAMAKLQVEVWRADGYGTELAQGLNARKLYDGMSPAGMLEQARQMIGGGGEKQWQRIKPAMDAVKDTLKQGNDEALQDLKADPETNQAARTAVNDAVRNSDTTHRAVIMELSQEWAQADPTGEIVRQAREQVGAKANEILTRRPTPPGLNAAQHLRAMMDGLAQRAAGIFGAHMQGAEPGVPIVDKFMQRLGLDRAHAVKLAGTLGKEWDRQLAAAKEKLDKRIINQRAKQLQGLTPDASDAAADRAIRQQLRDLQQRLGDVVKQASTTVDTTGKTIGQRILQASGLTGDAAGKLAETIDRRWNTLATDKKRALLEQLQKQQGAGQRGRVASAVDRLIKLSNLGAFSDSQFYDTAKKALKLPVLTDELAAEIVRQANDLQQMPEGVLRDRAAARLLNMAVAKGALKWTDVPMGIFYANILSGFTTPAKIILENTNLLLGQTVAALAARPGEVMRNPVDYLTSLMRAYGRGLVKGGLQAESTLRTGIVTGVTKDIHPSSVMELKPFGEKMEPLNFWKWFGRVVGVGHETTFKPAWEIKSQLMARDVASKEGLAGAALRQRVADLLANTEEHVTAAKVQATAELGGSGGMDYQRRVREIIEHRREQNMPGITETSRDFALRTAYLNDPYGFLGLIAKGIRGTLNLAKDQYPALGTVTKTQIPFTTIVANIVNEKLNWTPVGLLRATVADKTGELYGREMMDDSERAELYGKAILGTIALTSLVTLAGDHIHGNGPGSPEARKQLAATGWIPHSIEFHGKFYSYMNTPLALGLAVAGNMLDWERYGHGTDAGVYDRVAFAAKATINAIVSQGMLDSVKRIFDALGDESTAGGADKLEKLTARTASSFVVPNLLQQVDRVFDPTAYDQTGMKALVTSQIPFVRRENKPVLNVLGEPLKSGPFHYWASSVTDDALWKILAAKQAWVPEPSKNQIIGDKAKGEGYYRAMTADEYYDWIATTGPEIREALTENLDKIALAPQPEAKKIVAKIAGEIRRQDKPQE